eukprot:7343604-Prymnesium_polylepis.1
MRRNSKHALKVGENGSLNFRDVQSSHHREHQEKATQRNDRKRKKTLSSRSPRRHDPCPIYALAFTPARATSTGSPTPSTARSCRRRAAWSGTRRSPFASWGSATSA